MAAKHGYAGGVTCDRSHPCSPALARGSWVLPAATDGKRPRRTERPEKNKRGRLRRAPPAPCQKQMTDDGAYGARLKRGRETANAVYAGTYISRGHGRAAVRGLTAARA